MSHPSSARLLFRSWQSDDLAIALELWGDPQVTRLIDARGQLDRALVEERLTREIAFEREHGVQYWPILLRDGGELVGCAGLRPRNEPGVLELGFHLCARWWGQGFATEAAQAVIDHAFEVLEVVALFAGHHPNNHASQRVLEKLGFRRTHEELYAPTGLFHPSYRLERDR